MPHLVCIECSLDSPPSAKAWQAQLVDLDDGDEDGVVFYCPTCAEREFGQRLDTVDF